MPDQLTEVKVGFFGKTHRFVCDVAERSHGRTVVIYRLPRAWNVHGVELPGGTISLGYFWPDRPFNLYHWVSRDGTTLAYYFNIGDVLHYDDTVVQWHDLIVDVLVTPDGRIEVLDEDELPADIDSQLRHRIMAACDDLQQHISSLIEDAEQSSRAILNKLALERPTSNAC